MRRGHGFRDGKLYVFTPDVIEVLRPWGPRLGAWRFTRETGWHSFVPEVSIQGMEAACRSAERELVLETGLGVAGEEVELVRPAPATFGQRKADAYQRFLNEIPERVRTLVRRFRSGSWPLLRMAKGCEEPYLELLESTPALGFALAVRGVPNAPYRCAEVSSLLRRRQREIAARLGYPPNQSTVRLLRKIPVPTLAPRVLHHLRQALMIDAIAVRMRHVPRLNASALRILCDPLLSRSAAHSLLVEVCNLRRDDRHPHFAWELKETVDLLRRMDEPAGLFASVKQVRDTHERCVERLGGVGGRAWTEVRGEFPPPPVPEIEGIEAIRTPAELSLEGRAMKHCVASYASDAADGRMYFYRMLRPARATVALRCTGEGWRLTEVRGFGNANPSHSVMRAISRWLEDCPARAE